MTEKNNNKGDWRYWVVAGLAVLLCVPLLLEYFRVYQRLAYYSIWYVLLLVLFVLFYRRWKVAPVAEKCPPGWSVVLFFVVGMALLLVSYLYYTPWLTMAGTIVLAGAGALHLLRYRAVDNLLGMWLALFFLLRPPYQMALRFLSWMEDVSADAASLILDYGSVLHDVRGDVLALPGHNFLIEEVCSGPVSAVSTLATAAVVVLVRGRGLLHTLSLFFLGGVAAWIVNVFRILLVVAVHLYFKVDLFSGTAVFLYHAVSFFGALVLLSGADALLVFLWSGLDKKRVDGVYAGARAGVLSRCWSWLVGLRFGGAAGSFRVTRRGQTSGVSFVILVFLMLVWLGIEALVVYHRPLTNTRAFMYGEDELAVISRDSVSFDRAGWEVIGYNEERRDFASVWGALSNTWRLNYNGITVTMSLDYPFDDWHDVKACYSKIGWRITKEQIASELPVFEWRAAETDLRLPNGDYGFIMCSHSDHIGRKIQPKPLSVDRQALSYRMDPAQMAYPFGTKWGRDENTHYQTQCMVATATPLEKATRDEIRTMYAIFREQTRKAIAEASKKQQRGK